MNRRQKIKKLKHDNEFMKKIIDNTPEMERIYKAYNEPIKNIIKSDVEIREFRNKKVIERGLIPPGIEISMAKECLEKEMTDIAKRSITYKMDNRGDYYILTASIYLGITKN